MPTEQFAQKASDPRTLQEIEEISPECFARSTNKTYPIQNDGETQRPVEPQFIYFLLMVRDALFVPGC